MYGKQTNKQTQTNKNSPSKFKMVLEVLVSANGSEVKPQI